MRAASYSSCGMPCMPPSAITIMNGKPSQTLATMQASNACAASPSQLTGASDATTRAASQAAETAAP